MAKTKTQKKFFTFDLPPGKAIRLFENPILEKLTHVHPLTPAIFWLPVVAWLLYRSIFLYGLSAFVIAEFAAIGLVTWTLTEYLMHRFVFHFTNDNKIVQRIHHLIHGIHHDDPEDATRLVMPPAAAIVLATALWVLFRVVFGPVYIEPFFAFFLVGYLAYDYIHFYIHHFTPTTTWGKKVKQHHMLHHYAIHGAKWGVSSPFWDVVFGTVQEKKPNKPTSQSVSSASKKSTV